MMTLKNRKAIVEELAEMLKSFDMELNPFQISVYLDYDEEEQTGELFTVYGNSYSNDGTEIYYELERNDTYFEMFEETSDLAYAVGIPEKELIAKAAKYFEEDADEIERYYVEKYIESNKELMDRLMESYEFALDNCLITYNDRAEEIISEWENPFAGI